MSHRNAALSFEGRRRLVRRCQHRPIAHVAAEAGVSRQCLSKWVHRWRQLGDEGLHDRTSRPSTDPTATPPAVVARILVMRTKKWSACRIARECLVPGLADVVCPGFLGVAIVDSGVAQA